MKEETKEKLHRILPLVMLWVGLYLLFKGLGLI
jgi:hypothetical protein